MEIALLGQMGRDEALAARLQDHKLHIIGTFENPGLIDKAEQSGGQFHKIDAITNVAQITECVEHIQPDMFLTNLMIRWQLAS